MARTTAGRDTDVEGMRWGWKKFREDKEIGRKVLTSTDFTTAKWGRQ